MMPDPEKIRRETIRWTIVLALNHARPYGIAESVVHATLQAVYPDASALETRRELDYLADRKLVEIRKSPAGPWHAELTRYGVDLAEYTVDCLPGIARPAKYW